MNELIESILSILGIVDRTSGNRPEQIATLEQELNAYITANYTPNTKRPYLTYPGMVYYGERMNELRSEEGEATK
jgi:hypothetical protein